jgi:hypothetical protein
MVNKFAAPCFSKHLHYVMPSLDNINLSEQTDSGENTSTFITKLPSAVNAKIYAQLVPLIKSFVASTIRLLSSLSSASSLRQFILRNIRSTGLPYFVEFPRHFKALLNISLDCVFLSEQSEDVVVLGIGVLKDLIVLGARVQSLAQKSIVEKVLKVSRDCLQEAMSF